MSVRMVVAARVAGLIVLFAMSSAVMAADDNAALFAHVDVERSAPQSAGSFSLPQLRIRPHAIDKPHVSERSRYVEKPWKSYVCVGCELNNRPAPDR